MVLSAGRCPLLGRGCARRRQRHSAECQRKHTTEVQLAEVQVGPWTKLINSATFIPSQGSHSVWLRYAYIPRVRSTPHRRIGECGTSRLLSELRSFTSHAVIRHSAPALCHAVLIASTVRDRARTPGTADDVRARPLYVELMNMSRQAAAGYERADDCGRAERDAW
jgi:hypothetical protein